MTRQIINFGIIGGGLMGREFVIAAAGWRRLLDLDFEPRIVAACSRTEASLAWFARNAPDLRLTTTDYHELLADPGVEAVYCAVPHNLHAEIYIAAIRAGKHLFGEKPFGIDREANRAILDALQEHPQVFARCVSQFPFYPGAQRIAQWAREGRLGRLIEVEAGFWHSSDLNPQKPLNWKRQVAANGEYGCMGDLGMHILYLPLRLGWQPQNVRALLSKIVKERPDRDGKLAPCDTWDNALLACEAASEGQTFPMLLSTKRIAPGHSNTWFVQVMGTELSAAFSTQNPKQLQYLPYTPGGEQAWRTLDMPYQSAYPTITGPIFEFGFSDALLQMWAAFCDELLHGAQMRQPFGCATPEETRLSHALFTAALTSQRTGQTVPVHS